MAQLVSVYKSDRRFISYLQGTFSPDHRALPQSTISKNSKNEQVIFKILPKAECQAPSLWHLVAQIIRWPYLTFSLSPLFATAALLFFNGESIDVRLALWTVLGILFLQLSAHLFNDYHDHVKGYDRDFETRGSRAIQLGWMSAHQVLKAAISSMGIAIVFAVPVLMANPSILILIAPVVLLAVIGFSSQKVSLKNRGLGELTLMLLGGPLLTVGFCEAVMVSYDWSVIAIGFVFGLLTAIVFHLKNIAELKIDEAVQQKTLATALGFDRSIRYLKYAFFVLPVLVISIGLSGAAPIAFLLSAVFIAVQCYRLEMKLRNVMSTFSSQLVDVRVQGLILHLSAGLAFTFSFVLLRFLV